MTNPNDHEEQDEDIITAQPSRISPPQATSGVAPVSSATQVTRPGPIVPPLPSDRTARAGSLATPATNASQSQSQLSPTFPSPAYSQSQLDIRRQMELHFMTARPQDATVSAAFDRPIIGSRQTGKGRRGRQNGGRGGSQLQQQQRHPEEDSRWESFYRGLSWCLGW